MSDVIRVLVVEDLDTDAELEQREVRKVLPESVFLVVETREDYVQALTTFAPDIILSDYTLPSFDGLEALHLAVRHVPDTPFVIVTGSINEETAVACMKAGAWDYILKERILRLGPAVVAALDRRRERQERAQANEAVRASEARFRAVFHGHAAVKLLIDPFTRRIIDANRAAETFYGWSRDELLGMPLQDINRLSDEAYTSLVTRIRDDGRSHFELQHYLRDGSVRDVEIFSSRIVVNGSELLHSVIHDISDRKRAQRELVLAKEQAECASKTKSEFLANMSHEIRTPLNGIVGMMQLLETTMLDPEQAEYVRLAHRSAERLTRLLSDILDISSIEAGKLHLRREEFTLSGLCDAVLDLFGGAAREKGLRLECVCGLGVPSCLVGDERRIHQILFNLLANAIKFTANGVVGMQVERAGAEADGRVRLVFIVTDTGIGISDDKVPELFEAFAQGDGSFTRRFQGAGLGLAIVRRLVDQMDGRIEVQSRPGVGTTFRITLPVDEPDAVCVAPEAERVAPTRGLRVLLAEDDHDNRFALRLLLQRHGHEVCVAEDGNQAVQMVQEHDLDCVLMDVQMPVKSGLEATLAIRALPDPAKRNVTIIAMTAYAMSGDREKFLGAGVDGYLAKPVLIDDVLAAISTVRRRGLD